jgi:hypothetical protein
MLPSARPGGSKFVTQHRLRFRPLARQLGQETLVCWVSIAACIYIRGMDLGKSHFLADGALVWLEDQIFRHIVICYKMHKPLSTSYSS